MPSKKKNKNKNKNSESVYVWNNDELVDIAEVDEEKEKTKQTTKIKKSIIETENKKLINKYHGLSRIEDSFRVIKSDLEGRPIHVWTKEHINAHFLICFIALTIIRIIQYKFLKSENKNTLIETIKNWLNKNFDI